MNEDMIFEVISMAFALAIMMPVMGWVTYRQGGVA